VWKAAGTQLVYSCISNCTLHSPRDHWHPNLQAAGGSKDSPCLQPLINSIQKKLHMTISCRRPRVVAALLLPKLQGAAVFQLTPVPFMSPWWLVLAAQRCWSRCSLLHPCPYPCPCPSLSHLNGCPACCCLVTHSVNGLRQGANEGDACLSTPAHCVHSRGFMHGDMQLRFRNVLWVPC
jgi:hypothetical protein